MDEDNALRLKKQREKTAKYRKNIRENNPAKHAVSNIKKRASTCKWYAEKRANMTAVQLYVHRQKGAAAARKHRQLKKLLSAEDEASNLKEQSRYAEKRANMTAAQLDAHRQKGAVAARKHRQMKKLLSDEIEFHEEIIIAKSPYGRDRKANWRRKCKETNLAKYKANQHYRNVEVRRQRLNRRILSIYPDTPAEDLVPKQSVPEGIVAAMVSRQLFVAKAATNAAGLANNPHFAQHAQPTH